MSEIRGYAVVGQSGGPTAAINATLAGVIEGVITSGGGDICGLLGMMHGIDGLLSENFVDLSAEFTENGELDTKRIARLRRHRLLLSVHADTSFRIRRMSLNFTSVS